MGSTITGLTVNSRNAHILNSMCTVPYLEKNKFLKDGYCIMMLDYYRWPLTVVAAKNNDV